MGCIYNSAVLISDQGEILNHQRKVSPSHPSRRVRLVFSIDYQQLVPTFYEKLVWANGDGAGLNVVDTERCGKVGALLCGENTNPLARWSLMAQGEQLHLTTWPPLWPTRRMSGGGKQYDNLAANRTRTAAHCFEAKCFGVLCSGFMDKEMRGA